MGRKFKTIQPVAHDNVTGIALEAAADPALLHSHAID